MVATPVMRTARRVVLLLLLLVLLPGPASVAGAQTFAAGADLLFYGDNTEFHNPFRKGETLLGTAGFVYLDIRLSDRVTLRGGLFGNGRYGSHEFLEQAEPMIALELKRGPSRFIFGSLETSVVRVSGRGPDRETPHGLLPPLQQETLSFTRAHEMGLQWRVTAPRFDQDAWIEWQRLNTEGHRERFDAGYRARRALGASLALHGQWHVVHEGGQQFASGAVRDSHAWAAGLEWSREIAGIDKLSLEGHGVLTRDTPNRERERLSRTGAGLFLRGAVEEGPWRAHLIVWRGDDALKDEGDPNYLSRRRDGRRFRRIRDYGEAGLTRGYEPAPGVRVSASFRLHRIESHYEYSYRIVARVGLRRGF